MIQTPQNATIPAVEAKPKSAVMNALLKDEPAFSALPKVGSVVEGTVIEKSSKKIFVDLGSFGTGIVFGRELIDAYETVKKLKTGDKIWGKVADPENEDGYVELSLAEASRQQVWDELKEKLRRQEVLAVKVSEANRGGLVAPVSGIKAFLPVSQLSQKHYPRVEGGDKEKILAELTKMVGRELKVKIIDIAPEENKLIISEKEVGSEETAEFLKNFKVGDVVEGEVAGIVDFGAFVKIPAQKAGLSGTENQAGAESPEFLEGLIHISELDYRLIDNPQEVVKVGDKIQAKIIDISGDKISLSLKRLKEDPWKNVEGVYKKGETVAGEVTKFNPFGAFIRLSENIHGLVHVSEFGSEHKMKESLILGQSYNFKILSIESEAHRIALGLVSEG